jgi:hypothetical protein
MNYRGRTVLAMDCALADAPVAARSTRSLDVTNSKVPMDDPISRGGLVGGALGATVGFLAGGVGGALLGMLGGALIGLLCVNLTLSFLDALPEITATFKLFWEELIGPVLALLAIVAVAIAGFSLWGAGR